MFKRSLLIGTIAAAAIAGTASAHQTIGNDASSTVTFEDGSSVLAELNENQIVRFEDGIYLVTWFEDMSATYDRIDIASSINRFAQ